MYHRARIWALEIGIPAARGQKLSKLRPRQVKLLLQVRGKAKVRPMTPDSQCTAMPGTHRGPAELVRWGGAGRPGPLWPRRPVQLGRAAAFGPVALRSCFSSDRLFVAPADHIITPRQL